MRVPEIEYPEFREKVERFDSSFREYNFCKGIDGGCCKANVSMVYGDKKIISDALARGDIKKWVVKRAQRRAKDPKVTQCPFLGRDKKCTIYPHRPVHCIQHGNGGIPLNVDEDIRAMAKGSKATIKTRDLGTFSCKDCALAVDGEAEVPAEVVLKSVFIRSNVSRKPSTPLNTFILRELPVS
ncbi:MAG: YkgJ family cysteine cluster protein [Candidatus Levybacteria bacterium]|nr:YkgJ family cysteine cluster protein [Candidatus Levybacteria bacterium]